MTEVIVVSAFGRGHWLAAEIAKHSMSVTLVDVSDFLGRWAPEDWEGPFGWLQHDGITSSQMACLNEQDYSDEISSGFSIWLKDGPLDTRGPLQNFWSERKAPYELAREYIEKFPSSGESDRESMQEDLIDSGYQNNWLAQFSHQFASSSYMPNALALMKGRPLPLWSPFSVRRVTRKGVQKSLDWCREQNVKIITNSRVEDIAVEGKSVTGIQVQGDTTEVVGSRHVVWCLSSEETSFVSSRCSEKFFAQGPLLAEWCWMRWRLKGQLESMAHVIPQHLVLIEDMNLSWTHDNMFVMQKCTSADMFDVWARVPGHHRFQKNYLEKMSEALVEKLNARIPGFACIVQDQPQEFHYSQRDLGPCLYPVFNLQSLNSFEIQKYKNFHYAGVEKLENMDWSGRFDLQSQILKNLIKWKQNEIAQKMKGGRNDQQIQPS